MPHGQVPAAKPARHRASAATGLTRASGAEKTTATAVVVTELVAQRVTMRDGMMKMQEGMMTHMMEHKGDMKH